MSESGVDYIFMILGEKKLRKEEELLVSFESVQEKLVVIVVKKTHTLLFPCLLGLLWSSFLQLLNLGCS